MSSNLIARSNWELSKNNALRDKRIQLISFLQAAFTVSRVNGSCGMLRSTVTGKVLEASFGVYALLLSYARATKVRCEQLETSHWKRREAH